MKRALAALGLFAAALLCAAPAVAEPAAPEAAPAPSMPAAPSTPAARSPLTLAQVFASIERDLPAVAASRADQRAARGDRTAADGGFDTTLRARAGGAPQSYYRTFRVDGGIEQPTSVWGATLFGGYRLGRGDFAVYDGKSETNELGEARAGLAVPLLRNGPIDRRRASRTRGALGEAAAEQGLRAQLLDAKRQGGLRYWAWVAAGRRRDVARTLLENALRRDEQISARVARGDLPAIERTENARAILQRRSQLASDERALQKAAIELSQYLRAPGGAPIVPTDDQLPPLSEPTSWPTDSLREAAARAVASRPDLKRIGLARESARVEAEYARNQRLPALDLLVVVSKDLGDGSATRRPVEVEAQVLFEVPLQNRQASGRAEAARAALAKVAEQERGARDRVVADVQDARSATELARTRLTLARAEVEVSVDLERAEWQRFAAGDTTLLVVNLREQATFAARVREIDALAECQSALVLQRAATGALE